MNTAKLDGKQKKQDLGIFYTPPEVACFIFDMLAVWKDREDKETDRWQSRKPKEHFPSVIDPAVGEGVFLKAALEKGFTNPNYVFGVDIDESVKEKWVEINLLKSFGSRAELEVHFFHQNGLLLLDENKILRYKTGGLKQFDAVVGNPPYGGVGVDFQGKLSPETQALLGALAQYELFRWKKAKQKNGAEPQSNTSLFSVQETQACYSAGVGDVARMAEGIPIEILFVERFLQLAKPGGWVAVVIPDGILTNSNAHYVREFVAQKARVEAIVSLPRGTFKQAGTSAKTSILFLRKQKEGESPAQDYLVFLASVEEVGEDSFNKVADRYREFYNRGKSMNKSDIVKIIKDQSGKEAVMVRADKTLKEMMEEKPSSRWNVDYWQPKYEEIADVLRQYKVVPLGNFIAQTVSGYRGKTEYLRTGGIRNIEAVSILASGTGVDPFLSRQVKVDGRFDNPNRRTKLFDLLFARSGVGTSGRSVLVSETSKNMVIGGHILRVVLNREAEPEYIQAYLKTFFGWEMLDRVRSGVGALVLDEMDVRSIPIPLLKEPIRKNIGNRFKEVMKHHDKAMEAKQKGAEVEYKKHLETAEKMLRDLTDRTEAVIRGEKGDVI